jgi:hypothetical protein
MALRYLLKHKRQALHRFYQGARCPLCLLEILNYEPPLADEYGVVTQAVACGFCGSEWTDRYTLERFEKVRLGPTARKFIRKQKQNWTEGKPIYEL